MLGTDVIVDSILAAARPPVRARIPTARVMRGATRVAGLPMPGSRDWKSSHSLTKPFSSGSPTDESEVMTRNVANHGIGFDTAAIELLLPTYAAELGLVFFATGSDRRFHAYDRDTGAVNPFYSSGFTGGGGSTTDWLATDPSSTFDDAADLKNVLGGDLRFGARRAANFS